MNQLWSSLHKTMQAALKKKETYKEGITTLCELRHRLMEVIGSWYEELARRDFDAMPFIHAAGYHNKSIAYSLWHIFRIEDIAAHSLICKDEEVFFRGKYQKRINSPLITTGNELVKEQIADFSMQLNIKELYAYIAEVRSDTEKIVKALSYAELKERVSEDRKAYLESLAVVSRSEKAVWLIEYWCSKDVRGLIQMPFSRHWIMHVEAALRIKQRLHP